MTSSEPQSGARTFLTDWFRRLAETGFHGGVFAEGLAGPPVLLC